MLVKLIYLDKMGPWRHLTINGTNADFVSIGPLQKNSSKILLDITPFSFKKMYVSS